MIFWKKHKKKRRKRAPMKRYIYLMERTTNKTWISILSGKREIKIGIAKDSQQRHKSVNAGIPGRVVFLNEFLINRASTVEAALHRKYKADNFKVKGAKEGAGATEFFRLTNSEFREIERFLQNKSGQQQEIKEWVFSLFFSILVVLSVYFLK